MLKTHVGGKVQEKLIRRKVFKDVWISGDMSHHQKQIVQISMKFQRICTAILKVICLHWKEMCILVQVINCFQVKCYVTYT